MFLGATVDIAIWSTVEQGLAITAGSLATLRPLFFLAMSRLGLTTAPRQSYGGKSGPLGGGMSSKNSKPNTENKQDSLRPDVYKLSTVIETRRSHDSDREEKWYPTALPPVPTKESKKLSKRQMNDNESERSLKIKTSTSSDDEDNMQIMVSKSFYITDEERSLASRETPYR
jgi:hypothetical protein